MGRLKQKKTTISPTNLKTTHSPYPHYIPKPEQKSVVNEKVKLKKNKTLADTSEIFKKNCSSPIQSVKVITGKNGSTKYKEPLEYISTEVVKMHCPSSQGEKVITRKFQPENKKIHRDVYEVFKKIRKSNRERKVNRADCYVYY